MTDIYGAIIIRNNKIIDPDRDKLLVSHPDWIYDENNAPIDVDDFHGWIGDGHVYGSWIGFFRTQMWLIHDCRLVRKMDIHDDYIVTEDKPFVVLDSLPGMDFIYLTNTDKFQYRYYLRTAIGDDEYKVYFGLGVSSDFDIWNSNRQNASFGFSKYEARQYEALFESQTRQGS